MHVHYEIAGLGGQLMQVFLPGIILAYLCIAGQFWAARRRLKAGLVNATGGDPIKAFGYLVAIFVLCSLSGYLPRMVVFPDGLMVLIHGALFACSWAFVLTRQTVVIAATLARG